MPLTAQDRLIVALDCPSVGEAEAIVERTRESVRIYKVGLELSCAGGLDTASRLVASGCDVFLDLKLHDIPNTVERATARIAAMGVRFLTVHAYPQTLAAAVRGAHGSALTLLGVTVLTSCDDADLYEAGYALGVQALVEHRTRQAREAGVGGLVLSAEEVAAVRALVGPGMVLVTPGIRPAGAAASDQKRVMTPAEALKAGADHLVVGRPITAAPDPAAAARALIAEIAAAP